jgi:spermidine synthase
VRSDFQDILIFESHTHGRVMLLDGVVQITERDEFVYQEMLTHVPLLAHGAAKRVLIIGAGDGGVLKRALQHRNVERAVMVEIDGEVIRLAKEHLPGIAGDAWGDPRAEVIVGDGIDYVRQAGAGSFDVVIVDSTDPIGVGEVLFTDEFYRNAARLLSERGVIVNQCGVPFMQADELRETSERRARFFGDISAYVAAVPTYVGGFMTLGWAAKAARPAPGPRREESGAAPRRPASSGLTRYWTPGNPRGALPSCRPTSPRTCPADLPAAPSPRACSGEVHVRAGPANRPAGSGPGAHLRRGALTDLGPGPDRPPCRYRRNPRARRRPASTRHDHQCTCPVMSRGRAGQETAPAISSGSRDAQQGRVARALFECWPGPPTGRARIRRTRAGAMAVHRTLRCPPTPPQRRASCMSPPCSPRRCPAAASRGSRRSRRR